MSGTIFLWACRVGGRGAAAAGGQNWGVRAGGGCGPCDAHSAALLGSEDDQRHVLVREGERADSPPDSAPWEASDCTPSRWGELSGAQEGWVTGEMSADFASGVQHGMVTGDES